MMYEEIVLKSVTIWGELFTILDLRGCGKVILLRAITGLEII